LPSPPRRRNPAPPLRKPPPPFSFPQPNSLSIDLPPAFCIDLFYPPKYLDFTISLSPPLPLNRPPHHVTPDLNDFPMTMLPIRTAHPQSELVYPTPDGSRSFFQPNSPRRHSHQSINPFAFSLSLGRASPLTISDFTHPPHRCLTPARAPPKNRRQAPFSPPFSVFATASHSRRTCSTRPFLLTLCDTKLHFPCMGSLRPPPFRAQLIFTATPTPGLPSGSFSAQPLSSFFPSPEGRSGALPPSPVGLNASSPFLRLSPFPTSVFFFGANLLPLPFSPPRPYQFRLERLPHLFFLPTSYKRHSPPRVGIFNACGPSVFRTYFFPNLPLPFWKEFHCHPDFLVIRRTPPP